jgi:hypothetical protein
MFTFIYFCLLSLFSFLFSNFFVFFVIVFVFIFYFLSWKIVSLMSTNIYCKKCLYIRYSHTHITKHIWYHVCNRCTHSNVCRFMFELCRYMSAYKVMYGYRHTNVVLINLHTIIEIHAWIP